MKKKIYFLFLILIFSATTEKSFSQNYLSLFGDTSTTWDVILSGACDNICSQTVTVTGDTTINSNTYKVISGLQGFVREDTVLGKVWFYDTDNSTEYLVMDLGLNLGDTFDIYFSNVAMPMIVDSVYYVNNLKRVRLNAWTAMCSLDEKITFIEGSGTTAGLSYQRHLNGNTVNSYMLCHHKNEVKVSGNILFNDSCSYCSVGIAENNSAAKTVKISPNPVQNLLTINFPSPSPPASGGVTIAVYDVAGRKIVLPTTFINNKAELTTTTLPNGIYLLQIINNITGVSEVGKFVKE